MELAELGTFLRNRRERVRPQDVGLPVGPRRRVSGLRRDEVAQLAGASTDYYIQLERGAAQPSEQMLAALARALRLTHDERDYLFRLAARPLPSQTGSSAHVQPGMLDLLDRLPSTPAQVITDLQVTLVQNPLARALLGAPPETRGPRASFLYRWFTEPDSRRLYPPEEHDHHSRAFVSDLRAVVGRRGRDPQVTDLIDNLLRYSSEFAELWARQDVAVRRSDRKRIVHPSLGVLDLNCLTLFSEDGQQRLLWFTAPPGSAAVEQLELLSVIGLQQLTPDTDPPSDPKRAGGSIS
ncbi:helix-turn-helix domain-containing protein [Saccharopolyspora sp. K220]|uniref:MmyB family transcriptional regulator n=1 Tax=Saccharopolyspora soli TaxID=2926618 RepID=UPI001F5AA84F|nr:helix-turn-helix domain-containing protein [Saccharopolyspora soli]MCI2416681.1 helix-turn-helix domain-containing protein [Saccharopolyspora soli]